MLEFLLETKNEYMTILKNKIMLKIYNKFLQIYNVTKNEKHYLKSFQQEILKILQWDTNKQYDEKMNLFKKDPVLMENLCKGLMKSYMRILLFNPYNKNQMEVDAKYYEEFDTTMMIVNIYKQCIKNLWENPFLFNDKCISDFEYKTNQLKIYTIINNSIVDGFRESLPTEYILLKYLENKPENIQPVVQPNNMPVVQPNNMPVVQPNNMPVVQPNNMPVVQPVAVNMIENKPNTIFKPRNDGNKSIDQILENNDIKLTETKNKIVDEIDMKNKELDKKKLSEKKTTKEEKETNIDSKINKILENDLKVNDTKNSEKNIEIIEKFSNSEVNKNTQKDTNNEDDFFNNYLNNI